MVKKKPTTFNTADKPGGINEAVINSTGIANNSVIAPDTIIQVLTRQPGWIQQV
jgi:hypothetical protein